MYPSKKISQPITKLNRCRYMYLKPNLVTLSASIIGITPGITIYIPMEIRLYIVVINVIYYIYIGKYMLYSLALHIHLAIRQYNSRQ